MTMGLQGVCTAPYSATHIILPDDDRGGLYRASSYWSPRKRGPETIGGYSFFRLWRSSGFSTDNAPMQGTDWNQSGDYTFPETGLSGKRGDYFVKGSVVDETDTPQTGVLVMLFRSSDSLFVAQGFSQSDGSYGIPTPYSGVSHFVVAYLDAATDKAGTTVNNLIPTAS